MNSTMQIGFKNLQVSCIIGSLDIERNKEQTIFATLEIGYTQNWNSGMPTRKADPRITPLSKNSPKGDQGDPRNPVIDYRLLAKYFCEEAISQRYYLLESLAEGYAQRVFKEFPFVDALSIEIHKPSAISDAESAFVRYTLG